MPSSPSPLLVGWFSGWNYPPFGFDDIHLGLGGLAYDLGVPKLSGHRSVRDAHGKHRKEISDDHKRHIVSAR